MKATYEPSIVALSFGIAFLGSYLAISVCEQYRQLRLGVVDEKRVPQWWYLVVMAVCLGGVGIWCMHFVGMHAVTMYDDNDVKVDVRYNIGLTVLSLLVALILATIGLLISAMDNVFSKSRREIYELIVTDASAMSMQSARNITSFQLLWIIGTHSPKYLVLGGLCAGSGIIVMHYTGMTAMTFPGRIIWDVGTIIGSCFIAFVAATAAFWILFRFLSTYTNREYLRLLSAFLMAVAVCGMHYTGMAAARFEFDSDVNIPVRRTMSSNDAFLSGLIVTSVVSFIAAVMALADLRYNVAKLSYELSRADETIMSLPAGANAACLNHIQRYIVKRKASNCSLGILNQTAVFEADYNEDANTMNSGGSGGSGGLNNGHTASVHPHNRSLHLRSTSNSVNISTSHSYGTATPSATFRRRVQPACSEIASPRDESLEVMERGEAPILETQAELRVHSKPSPEESMATLATTSLSNRNIVVPATTPATANDSDNGLTPTVAPALSATALSIQHA
jgi:NO-binding membrane sensor protein with MHYT domain